MRACRERGYVLVAVFVLLLGAGAGLSSIAVGGNTSSLLLENAASQHQAALINARQSLISYATVYHYLYGPAGAGPGHFPCPDTDGFTQNIATAASGLDQRRDGPNPPCVAAHFSKGNLPRHTVLPGHRYLFHAQSEQKLRYEVNGQMINNPINRVVNLSTLQSSINSEIASVFLPSEDSRGLTLKVPITSGALINPTVAAVAAWVIQRSNRFVPQPDPVSGQNAVDAQCHQDRMWLQVLDEPVVGGERETEAASENDECIVNRLEDNVIEGVPALRHWFVRNQWYLSIAIGSQEACAQEDTQGVGCRLVYPSASRVAISQGASSVSLQWVAVP